MKQYKIISLCLLLSLMANIKGYSQIKFVSELPVVEKSGFYDIELNPEQVSLSLRQDLLDIRIYQDGKEQAFITNVSNNKIVKTVKKLSLTQNVFKDSTNVLVLESDKSLQQIYIAINKSEVNKFVSVRGSHDNKKWFIIKDKSRLNMVETNATEDIYSVDLPSSEYKYLEFTLTNDTKQAMEILWTGIETKELIESEFKLVKLGSFSVKDSAKRTFINFSNLKVNYRFEKIKINVESDFGYLRTVRLGNNSFEISSKNEAPKNINMVLTKKDNIEIFNADNPPLKVKSVEVYQLKRYITVFLKEGLVYTMESGKKETPNYDLKYLQSEIPQDREIIEATTTDYIYPNEFKAPPRELKWFETSMFLWGTIGIVGLFLLLLCFGLIRQIEKKKTENKD